MLTKKRTIRSRVIPSVQTGKNSLMGLTQYWWATPILLWC